MRYYNIVFKYIYFHICAHYLSFSFIKLDVNGNNATNLTNCSAGFYISINATSSRDRECTACPADTYTNRYNQYSCANFTDCKIGEYIHVNGTAKNDRVCNGCFANTFSSSTNQFGCTNFTDCKIGEYIHVNVNATNGIKSIFETENIANRFFILDLVIEIIEWSGIGLLLIAFLIVLFESLVFLKVVYKQRKISRIQKRSIKSLENDEKKDGDVVDDDDDDRVKRRKSVRRTFSVSPRNLKRLKHEFESHDKKKIFVINQIKEKQRRNTVARVTQLRDKLKHNAARQRLGMGLLHKHKHKHGRRKILPKPPPGQRKGFMKKKFRNNFKIPVHKRRDKIKKTQDLMVDEVVEEFHSNAELYNLEVELIRNKQLERTKQKLALRREKRRQMLVTEKKKRERSQAWKKQIFIAKALGNKEKFKNRGISEDGSVYADSTNQRKFSISKFLSIVPKRGTGGGLSGKNAEKERKNNNTKLGLFNFHEDLSTKKANAGSTISISPKKPPPPPPKV